MQEIITHFFSVVGPDQVRQYFGNLW